MPPVSIPPGWEGGFDQYTLWSLLFGPSWVGEGLGHGWAGSLMGKTYPSSKQNRTHTSENIAFPRTSYVLGKYLIQLKEYIGRN